MGIKVIHTDSVNAFDYMIYPEQNPLNLQYLQERLMHVNESLTDMGRQFMDYSRSLFDKLNDSHAARVAKAAIRMAKGIFHPDMIVPLETEEELQMAQPIMQRYIMACPDIRTLYHQQKCDGYSDTYLDVEPGLIGDSHYDYRRVMTGIIQDEEIDGKYSWVSRNYLDELHEGDRDLTVDERVDILSAWDLAKIIMDSGRDPTNPYGGDLAPL